MLRTAPFEREAGRVDGDERGEATIRSQARCGISRLRRDIWVESRTKNIEILDLRKISLFLFFF